MASLQALFERYALSSLEKQQRLSRLVGEHYFRVDLDSGAAHFNDAWECPFQVLGTESENTLTWLWGWADEQIEVPEHLLQRARELRQWGEQQRLAEFQQPSLDLDRADGLKLAVIATAVCRASSFYREHFEGGSLFVLLYGDAIDRQPGFDRSELVRAVNDLAAVYDVNQRALLTSYFREQNIPWEDAADSLSAQLYTGERLLAEFDKSGRIRTVNGEPARTGPGDR